MTFPTFLREYVSARALASGKAAYAEFDQGGIVLAVGGCLELFGPVEIRKGVPVQEVLSFMEGLVPFDGEPLILERVAISADIKVDAHVVPNPDGYGLLLLDVTEAVDREAELFQRANELSLIKRGRGVLSPEFKDLFKALDILAAEQEGTRFFPFGRLPEWAGKFIPLLDHPDDDWTEDSGLAYLADFLDEAREFWGKERFGFLRSGFWIDSDANGTEFVYEATAAFTGSKRILLVTRNQRASLYEQVILQRGRELALNHRELRREWDELRVARDKLEDRIRDRTRELETANERLTTALRRRAELENERAAVIEQVQQSQRIEALGTLAGGIAHDFNNILAAIVGFAETGLESVREDGEIRRSFSTIMEAADRAQELVRQILVMSRRADTETAPIRMKDVAEEVLRLMKATLPGTIKTVPELQKDGLVMANGSQLHQVVTNLCTNAGHAMRRSGGVLRVALRERELGEGELTAYPQLRPGHFAVLEVRDTGPGIPEAILTRIFDPFFTTKGPGEGTGIGLSVVHGVVTSANGAVTVETEMGKGSVFRVFWPLAQGSEEEAKKTDTCTVEGRESILFVDDEPMQSDLATRLLGKMGFQVHAFTDGQEALQRFKTDPAAFDLLITDLTMPGLTGEELAREVLKLRPEFPVVICSGHFEPEIEDTELADGIRRFLLKPLRWQSIGEAIREVLDET